MWVNLCSQPLFLNLMISLSQNLCKIKVSGFLVSTFLKQAWSLEQVSAIFRKMPTILKGFDALQSRVCPVMSTDIALTLMEVINISESDKSQNKDAQSEKINFEQT